MSEKKEKRGKWVAYHVPTGKEKFIFGETRRDVQDKLNTLKCWCGKKKCESLLAEWFILKTKDMFEANDFGDILRGAGYTKKTMTSLPKNHPLLGLKR